MGQIERELIQERVKSGSASARGQGKIGDKPRVSQKRLDLARREFIIGRPYRELVRIIDPQTLYRSVFVNRFL